MDPRAIAEPAATRVRDPLSGTSVWLAGILRQIRVDGETLAYELVFSRDHTAAERAAIARDLEAELRTEGWQGPIAPVERTLGVDEPMKKDGIPGLGMGKVAPHGGPIVLKPIPGVRAVVAVASGKGGVGKSTVACNLAVALRRQGLAVGLLDADVYGPSLPTMMGTRQRAMVAQDQRIVPVNSYGVRCLSMGLLLGQEDPVIWRGPMVMDFIRRFLQDVHWGALDVLIVDLPPGTGDVQLTLIQGTPLAGAVIVTTPQDVALADAIRGISMFEKLGVPILGLVENMAYYELPDGTRDFVFGEGGGERTAKRFGVELLAKIPLRTALRESADRGLPAALGDDATARVFAELAAKIAGKLPEATVAP
jgi:ATP-binding protein involved in chromosome partitioning